MDGYGCNNDCYDIRLDVSLICSRFVRWQRAQQMERDDIFNQEDQVDKPRIGGITTYEIARQTREVLSTDDVA